MTNVNLPSNISAGRMAFPGRNSSLIILSGILCGLLAITTVLRHGQSLTFDESFFLNCGLQTIHDGRLDPRICSEGVAPLPLMMTYVPGLMGTAGADCPLAWSGRMDAPELIQWPRFLNTVLFAVPLVVICCFWMQARRGWPAALLAAALVAASPLIVAHASVATMDIGFATIGLLAVISLGWTVNKPTPGRITLSALLSAAAISSKYSALFLFPAMAFLWLVQRDPSDGRLPFQTLAGWKEFLKKYAAWCILVMIMCWGLHLFSLTGPLKTFPLSKTPDDSPWVQILGRGPWALWIMDIAHRHLWRPAPVSGILFQFLHNQGGHPAFLLGEVSSHGWWYYFPLVFLFKSTPAELALFLFLVCLALSRPSPLRLWNGLDADLKAFLICSLIFLMMLLTAHINLGQRYLILLYPLLILSAVDALASRCSDQHRLFYIFAAMLAGSQLASQALSHPDQLAYFNGFCGGSKNRVHLLSDSNLDWGQGLPALKRYLDEHPHRRIAIDSYGYALPRAYGVDADSLSELGEPLDQYDGFVLSVTRYQFGSQPGGCYSPEWLRHPDRSIGPSLYFYELDTPEKKEKFAVLAKQFHPIPGNRASRLQSGFTIERR